MANSSSNSKAFSNFMLFCGMLTVVFIILKQTGVIAWSWLWVVAPILIPTAIILFFAFVYIFAYVVAKAIKGD